MFLTTAHSNGATLPLISVTELLRLAPRCKYLNSAAEKQGTFRQTYHDGSAVGVFVNMLVAQVEHKRSSAVEEGQHPDAHVELRWRRVVS